MCICLLFRRFLRFLRRYRRKRLRRAGICGWEAPRDGVSIPPAAVCSDNIQHRHLGCDQSRFQQCKQRLNHPVASNQQQESPSSCVAIDIIKARVSAAVWWVSLGHRISFSGSHFRIGFQLMADVGFNWNSRCFPLPLLYFLFLGLPQWLIGIFNEREREREGIFRTKGRWDSHWIL